MFYVFLKMFLYNFDITLKKFTYPNNAVKSWRIHSLYMFVLNFFRSSVPSSAPGDVEAHALSSRKIVVSWKAIPQNTFNGILRGYIIQYTDVDNSRHNQISVDGLQASLIDLRPFTRYRVRVMAYTNAGLGVASVGQTIRTYEDSKF